MTTPITMRTLFTTAVLSLGIPGCHGPEKAKRAEDLAIPVTPMDRNSCLDLLKNPGARFHVTQVDPENVYTAGPREMARMDGSVVSSNTRCTIRISAYANMDYGFLGHTRGDGFTWCERKELVVMGSTTTTTVGFVQDTSIQARLTAGLRTAFNLGVLDSF